MGPPPESSDQTESYDTVICVVVVLLASPQAYRVSNVAESISDSVYKLHGLQEWIISDCDLLFTFKFWKRLHGLLNTELPMSLAFHPRMDSATERANRTIDDQSSENSESTRVTVGVSGADLGRVPANEAESAAGWTLENGIKQVSVQEDDGTGAGGEPAGERGKRA